VSSISVCLSSVLLFISLCVYSLCVFSSDQSSKSEDSELNQNIETLVKQWLPNHCYHSGEFEQLKSLQGLPDVLRANGRYFYSCEHGFIWQLVLPVSDVLVYSKNGSSYKIAADGEKQKLTGRAERAIAELLKGVLGGDISVLKKRFDLVHDKSIFLLTPRRKKMRKFVAEIRLENKNDLPLTTLNFASGDVQSIQITEAQTHTEIDEQACTQSKVSKVGCQLIFGGIRDVSSASGVSDVSGK